MQEGAVEAGHGAGAGERVEEVLAAEGEVVDVAEVGREEGGGGHGVLIEMYFFLCLFVLFFCFLFLGGELEMDFWLDAGDGRRLKLQLNEVCNGGKSMELAWQYIYIFIIHGLSHGCYFLSLTLLCISVSEVTSSCRFSITSASF